LTCEQCGNFADLAHALGDGCGNEKQIRILDRQS
jgi:hypothetical protein